jgi:GNAT superfamily N-acetyltransferase/DNA-binding MarR family transcriptional regulator
MIEIGDYGRRAFVDLCSELKVTPAQLSRILVELVSSGAVRRDQGGSEELYSLTVAGARTLAEINAHAQDQVTKALAAAPPGAGASITAAFQAYAVALERSRPSHQADITPDITPVATPEPPAPPAISIVAGYRPGILARTLEMHLDYYYPRNGWGREFEAALSTGLGDLLKRLDRPMNQVWSAVLTTPAQGGLGAPAVERTVGVVYVDGEYSGREGVARLRAFIVDDSARGLGAGKKLFAAAMAFVRESGFRECELATQRSLTVARKLYEREGFQETSESWFEGFGKGFMEMMYVWRRDDES